MYVTTNALFNLTKTVAHRQTVERCFVAGFFLSGKILSGANPFHMIMFETERVSDNCTF